MSCAAQPTHVVRHRISVRWCAAGVVEPNGSGCVSAIARYIVELRWRCAERAGRGGRGSRACRRATRERHAVQLDGSGTRRPAPGRPTVSMSRGTAFPESGVPCAVPLTTDASVETKSRTAQHIVRSYRVLRGRAVRRGSASSASRLFSAPPAWSDAVSPHPRPGDARAMNGSRVEDADLLPDLAREPCREGFDLIDGA